MALIWADPFKSYGTNQELLLDGLYAQNKSNSGSLQSLSIAADPDPLASGNVLKFSAASGSNLDVDDTRLRWVNPGGAVATIGVAFRLWCSALPSDSAYAFTLSFNDIDNGYQSVVEVMSTGQLRLTRAATLGSGGILAAYDTNGVTLGTSTIPVLTANAWHHIEMKITIHPSAGTFECHVDGNEVDGLTLTGLNTRHTTNSSLSQLNFTHRIPSAGQSVSYYMKDFLTWDTTGTENNDFMGTVSVLRLALDGDVNLNWATSTGSIGYDLINDSPPVDTRYISADNSPPAASEFSFADLPEDITSVKALITLARIRKTDGGDGTVQMSVMSSGDPDAGADRNITTAFTYWYDVSELSGHTGDPYTPVEANAATVKIDRTSP